jgi:hypothetical protein
MADLELAYSKAYPRVLVCPHEEAQFLGQKLHNFFLAQFLGWRRNFCSSTTTIPPTAKQMADLELVYLKVYSRVLVCPYEEAQFSG